MRERLLTAAAAALTLSAAAAQVQAQAQSQTQTRPPDPQALQARSLAATCSNCHGTEGVARGEMKSLAGLSAEQITATMAAFKAGQLPATVMHQIAKGYSDEQIRLIAGYYAARPARGNAQ